MPLCVCVRVCACVRVRVCVRVCALARALIIVSRDKILRFKNTLKYFYYDYYYTLKW